MSDVPMPSALTEEAVAEWVHSFIREGLPDWDQYTITARAVLALCERVAVRAVIAYDPMANGDPKLDDVIARVLGREVPRGN